MRWRLFLVMACSLLSGCAAIGGDAADAAMPMQAEGFAADDEGAARPNTRAGVSASIDTATKSSPFAGRSQDQDRMLVYRGAVTVEVADPTTAMATFLVAIAQLGGHLSSQQGRTVVVRVPAAQFEVAWAGLRGLGRVLDESREANDVTDEFLDLGIRIDNARKARDRLLALLEKAEKVEDMLKIEEQLRRLTEEIERLEGKKKLLADQVALATLTATFAPVTLPSGRPTARRPAFDWMQHLGAERLMRGGR